MEELLQQLRDELRGRSNTTAHFMGQAVKYMQKNDVDSAKACLILLCEYCSNYEESMEFNGLTEQWKKYCYLVDGLVPPSVPFRTDAPCGTSESSVTIEKIFTLPDDDLLSVLSGHLSELSGLNKWERMFYYADELCMEVNSGGFEGYLYYHGTHFEKACQAFAQIGAGQMLDLADRIRNKFPRGRVPKSEEAIQNAMDLLEDRGVDFEEEDDLYYSSAENELLKCLLTYAKENRSRFR